MHAFDFVPVGNVLFVAYGIDIARQIQVLMLGKFKGWLETNTAMLSYSWLSLVAFLRKISTLTFVTFCLFSSWDDDFGIIHPWA